MHVVFVAHSIYAHVTVPDVPIIGAEVCGKALLSGSSKKAYKVLGLSHLVSLLKSPHAPFLLFR